MPCMLQGLFVQRASVHYEVGLCSCFELRNAYLHFEEKHYLIEMKKYIFKREVASAKECYLLPIEKESFFRLWNATPCE